jgi:hypothetical protein
MARLTREDVSGRTFGRLTVTGQSEIRGRCRVYWLCICSCSKEKWIIVDALKAGGTKSCGCLNDEVRQILHHGHAARTGHPASPEYTAWHSMKQRCQNPRNDKTHLYGGKGVQVCQEWSDNFIAFLEDMGPRPPGSTLERRNSNGHYEPGNCVWATYAEQNRNHSRNRWITFRGETLCLADWVARTGIPHATLSNRLKRWSLERALTEPRHHR